MDHSAHSETRIVQITNPPTRMALDGGTNRSDALDAFLCSAGAKTFTIRDEAFARSRWSRLLRFPRLLLEIIASRPELVVVAYPSFPFFWQFKVTPYFLLSLLSGLSLKFLGRLRGFRVVADITDLPAIQFSDLGYGIEMSGSTLAWYEKCVVRLADYVWVCSDSLADYVTKVYRKDAKKVLCVLNGYSGGSSPRPSDDTSCLRFAYAGSLNRERGTEAFVTAFLQSGLEDAELHLCGPHGDWLSDQVSGTRVVYHGELTDKRASEVLSGCHVGLIPYPERGYYNYAFATKFSFYLGLGLPLLTSCATEIESHVRTLGVGLSWPIEDFSSAFVYVAKHRDELDAWRSRVSDVRDGFSWTSIYSRALHDTISRIRSGC